jgi:predicted AAA+ superfamily ATPase
VVYRPRVLDAVLRDRLRSAGAVLVEGPKACGKTSLAEQVAASRVYLDVDAGAVEALAIDPALVLRGAAPQLVDEWQLASTTVWNHVRAEVDRRGSPGQFVLTGSSVPPEDDRRHTGAGRFARLRMRPMSLLESGESTGALSLRALLAGERPTAEASALTVPDVARLVVRGGWPLHLGLGDAAAAQANLDYLRTIAEIDVGRLDGTRRDPATAMRVLRALARNTGMEQKVARLAAEVDGDDGPTARSTLYDYLPALRRLLLLEEQPAWSPHLRSRATLRKAPRTHLVDPSLAAAALGAGSDRLLGDLRTLGLLFESLVVRDLRVYADPLAAVVHHHRDSAGREVDAVVQLPDGTWGAFEVKLGTGQVDQAAAGLLDFADSIDTRRSGVPAVLGVITSTGYGLTRPDGVVVVPIGHLGP